MPLQRAPPGGSPPTHPTPRSGAVSSCAKSSPPSTSVPPLDHHLQEHAAHQGHIAILLLLLRLQGRVRRRSAVLKEAPHHAAHHHTTQCSRGRLYLAAHVLLLSWKAAVLSAGLVGWRKRYDPDFGSRLQQSSVDVLSLIGRNSP